MDSNKGIIPVMVGMMLLTGVCNTLLTKYQDMQCVADCYTDHPKLFEQPVIQTLQMFVGESGCWLVVLISYLLRRFSTSSSAPSSNGDLGVYQPLRSQENDMSLMSEAESEIFEDLSESQTLVDPTNIVAKPILEEAAERASERVPLEGWKVALLALPAICDICGTTLMNAGLLFVAASIYQMTRGALVLFVGLFSVIFLKRHLGVWKWTSLFVVVLGVAIVGLAGYLDNKRDTAGVPGAIPDREPDLTIYHAVRIVRSSVFTTDASNAAQAVLGVLMIAGAQIFTASQFVLEEAIMAKYSMDPIRVVGWEGIFGFSVTLVGMGILHGAIGHGYFNANNAFYEVFTNRTIGITSILIMISIGSFNFFGLSVTRMLSATSRSTIDTCRTLFIWMVSLGLGWETFKWLQVVGFVLLVYGTGLFNDIISPPTLAFLQRRRRRSGLRVGNEDG